MELFCLGWGGCGALESNCDGTNDAGRGGPAIEGGGGGGPAIGLTVPVFGEPFIGGLNPGGLGGAASIRCAGAALC